MVQKTMSKAEAIVARRAHQVRFVPCHSSETCSTNEKAEINVLRVDNEQQAVKDEEERIRQLKERNAVHRKDIEGQIQDTHKYLLDGCRERGMTAFELKYNSKALAKAKALKAAGMLRV